MLRGFLLTLSRSARAERVLRRFPPARRVVRRFVAGEDLPALIQVAKELVDQGFRVIADHLGEAVRKKDVAEKAKEEYISLICAMEEAGIPDRYISLKLTHLGLEMSEEEALRRLREILEVARQRDTFVRIDMEESRFVDATFRIYELLHKDFSNLGVVLQAYLRRAAEDAERLVAWGANVRLVKGAYREPPEIAFPRKREVNENFDRLARRLTAEDARKKGVFLAVATHDPARITRFREHAQNEGVPREMYEFQFLYGIRRDLQVRLLDEGERVRIYVPYGSEWFPYFMRRLAERPANLWFFLYHLFRA